MTFENDLYKKFNLIDYLNWADVIVLDIVRDSYDILELDNGSIVTRGVEVEKYDMERLLPIKKKSEFGTLSHFEAWLAAIKKFAAIMKTSKTPMIFINARWGPLYISDWNISLISDFDQYGITRRNFIIAHYQDIVRELLPLELDVHIPSWINFADPAHPWGSNPMHLHQRTIDKMVEHARQSLKTETAVLPRKFTRAGREAAEQALREALGDTILASPEH